MFFTFPEDAHWNAERQAVEFGAEISEYHGVLRVPRRVFQRLLPQWPAPERVSRSYYLQRTRFESIAGRKLRRRRLTQDGNVGDRQARSGKSQLEGGQKLGSVSNRPHSGRSTLIIIFHNVVRQGGVPGIGASNVAPFLTGFASAPDNRARSTSGVECPQVKNLISS